jgi:phosphoenolpyruvate carboxylase
MKFGESWALFVLLTLATYADLTYHLSRNKPTVQKEAAGGCAVIESVLWDAVPSYLRKLDAQCRVSRHRQLLSCFPIYYFCSQEHI